MAMATPARASGLPSPSRPSLVPAEVAVADVLLASDQPPAAAGIAPAHFQLAYPLATPALQMDPWGWRYSESRQRWRMHTGIDLAADPGTPVLAALAGRVRMVESVAGYGLTVLLDHGDGVETLYSHLQRAAVRPGAWLEKGQVLGGVGMTGAATGPHLHFELRRRGERLLALDPTPHLPPPALPAIPTEWIATDP